MIKLQDSKWTKLLENVGPNPLSSRKFWKKINCIRNGKSSNQIPRLQQNGMDFNSDLDKAELFKEILAKTFSGKNNESDYDNTFKKETELTADAELNSIPQQIITFNIHDIHAAIKKIPLNSAAGPDGIHNQMLKNLPRNFKYRILDMANLSMSKSQLASTWKIAHITMLPKTSINKNDPTNYRPISLISCLGKLIERLVQTRLYNYLESNSLINFQQSGFRQKRRTSDNLVYISQKCQESFNRGWKVGALFFDISKAFDEVWHKGLISKMIKKKIPSSYIHWVYSFLTSRTFHVKINQNISSRGEILSGTSQGAIISPLLFNIFINDVPTENTKHSSFSLIFADDLATCFQYKKQKIFQSKVTLYLKKVEKWTKKWRLKMNIKKSNYTILCNGPNTNKSFKFTLFDKPLTHNPNPKFLGITFDEQLSFNTQTKNVRTKCISRLNLIKIIYHTSWKLSKKTLISVYRSLIGSVLDSVHL